jgi:deoxyribonuclease V
MPVDRPEFVPDASRSREEMEGLQERIAGAAVFTDDLGFEPAAVSVERESTREELQSALGEEDRRPLVAGVDQAFRDGTAVSAVVVVRGGRVVERAHATASVGMPYVPGLLSFREGPAVLAALGALDCEPDLLVVDGSGRIHFREAGLATHVGVTVDTPAVGVAKSLLCGEPVESLADPLPEGRRVAVEADDSTTASRGTVVGYALQTRQYDSGAQHVNPIYVSPGHRVSAATAADLVEHCVAGYKLPEPTRLADSYADEVKETDR